MYIYIYKCVEIFRERVEFAARDPFLSVSIESFVSARFQRVISRGEIRSIRRQFSSLPAFIIIFFRLLAPSSFSEIYKAVRFQMYNRIYNWILHNSSIEAHRARLPSCLPSFLSSFLARIVPAIYTIRRARSKETMETRSISAVREAASSHFSNP